MKLGYKDWRPMKSNIDIAAANVIEGGRKRIGQQLGKSQREKDWGSKQLES